MSTRVSKTIHIADTIHGSIQISDFEKKIISTRIFNRLHNISQNSTAYLTFPTNRTRRFEHSIGTMHLAGQMFSYGINNANTDVLCDFFAKFETKIDSIISEKLKKGGDPVYRDKLHDNNLRTKVLKDYKKCNVFDYMYRLNTPQIIYEKGLETPYMVLYQSIRLASMLHDVGHPPMSHITEYAVSDLWNEFKDNKDENDRYMEFYDCLNDYAKGTNIELHEKIGNELTKAILGYSCSKVENPEDEKQVNKSLFQLLVMDVTIRILTNYDDFYKWIHRIIDGSLDCDRLDYVTRDPINSGVDNGKIEYGRLLSTIRLVKYEGNFIFAPHLKMKDAIDDFFYRRWSLYSKIIYHHRVVKTDYLMESSIKSMAKDYLNHELIHDELVNDDSTVVPFNISGIWRSIKLKASFNEFFDNVLQWDDSWLFTVMKSHFYNEYKPRKDKTYYQLEELISNKKRFFALIKKDNEAMLLDKEIIDSITQFSKSILGKIEKLDMSNVAKQDQTKLNVDPTIERFKSFIDYVERIKNETNHQSRYVLSMFRFKVMLSKKTDKEYNRIIRESIDEVLGKQSMIADYFFTYKKVKTGVTKSLILYSENDEGNLDYHSYMEISEANDILERRRDSLIPVYIYLRKNDLNATLCFEGLIKQIGCEIGNKISKSIIATLDNMISIKEE